MYAKWTEIPKYTVKFESNGGNEVDSITQVRENTTITEPSAPTRDGFTFDGWYKDNNFQEKWNFKTDVVTAETTLYAKWTEIPKYTVNFESNGGSEVPSITEVRKDTKITEPEQPTRDGFTFDGWYKEKELTTKWDFATDVVKEETTLYAKWTEIPKYTVNFESNGGNEITSIT